MNAPKTILILGGSTMQMPAITIAKRKGLKVIVVDGNQNAEGKVFADYFEHIDLKNMEAIARTASTYKARMGLDGVFTAGTDFSTTVAYIADALGLPGIKYETALNATDKSRMRKIFREKGVSSPRFEVVRTQDDLNSIPLCIGFPLVMKPVDNMGARGVVRVDSEEGLIAAFKAAIVLSKSGCVIAEEYLEGPELSIDALVWQGNVGVCGVADRHIFFPPYFVEMGHTMPTNLPKDQVDDAIEVFKQGIRALGIDIGAAKGDIKITKNGPKVGEIAARLSGGFMSGWTYPFSSGVEITEAALNIAIGEEPGDIFPKKEDVSAERAFISIPGKISCIEGFENAIQMPKIKAGFIRVIEGTEVVFPKNNVEKCGNIISLDTNRADAIKSAEKAISGILIRLAPDNPSTEQFLFHGAHQGNKEGPCAFTLSNRDNLIALESMSAFSVRSPDSHGKDISIIALPFIEKEEDGDWHGKNLADSFYDLISASGVGIESADTRSDIILGRIFWKAFLKGGVQAGFYIVDTIRLLLNQSENLPERLKSWI